MVCCSPERLYPKIGAFHVQEHTILTIHWDKMDLNYAAEHKKSNFVVNSMLYGQPVEEI